MIPNHRGLLPSENGPVLHTMQEKGLAARRGQRSKAVLRQRQHRHAEASDTRLIRRRPGDSEDRDGSKQNQTIRL